MTIVVQPSLFGSSGDLGVASLAEAVERRELTDGAWIDLRPGFVTEEFLTLARTEDPTWEETARLTLLKRVMAEHVMSADAPDVYDQL